MSPSEKTRPLAGTATSAAPAAGASPRTGERPADRGDQRTDERRPTAGGASPARPGGVGAPPRTAAGQGSREGGAERPASPAGEAAAAADAPGAPRRVRLTLARLNPWSVAKLSFLLSVALGIVLVVAVALLWTVLDAMGVFGQLDGVIKDVVGSEGTFDLQQVIGLGRVLSVAVFVAVVDVVLITGLATIGAVLYNLASSLVGGLRVTLSDD